MRSYSSSRLLAHAGLLVAACSSAAAADSTPSATPPLWYEPSPQLLDAVNDAAAEKELQSQADAGEPDAQYWLGVLHAHGIGRRRADPALAAVYLHFGAESDSIGAQLAMGYRHLSGVDAPRSCPRAQLYFSTVAERVVAEANSHKPSRIVEKARLTLDNMPSPFGSRADADDEVIHYYEQSARKGSVDAQMTLAQLHYHGARGLAVDVQRAYAYYSAAAEAGEVAAFAPLGHMFAHGIGVAQSNQTALEYYRRGSAKGSLSAQTGLGYLYMHGHGVERSYEKALTQFQGAADKGNADAQFNLGAMHIAGLGVKKSPERAIHWFTLASHQGHTLALYNLAQMHSNGVGTPQSCDVSVAFFKAVAERGPWGTMLQDAHRALYDKGGTARALVLYLALAECGYEVAQANAAFLLDQHYAKSPGVPLLGLAGDELPRLAFELYRRSAMQGNTDAEIKMGDYYYYGSGTNASHETSVSHYRVAADARNPQAMFNLAYMYAHGLGLPRDLHLAKRHYDSAFETAAEAFLPVRIALVELRMLELWRSTTGRLDSPYDWVRDLIGAFLSGGADGGDGGGGEGLGGGAAAAAATAAVAPTLSGLLGLHDDLPVPTRVAELLGTDVLMWDTVLIAVLTIVLAIVLSVRSRARS